jgi:starvation-inducible outer membrane lipoprotein
MNLCGKSAFVLALLISAAALLAGCTTKSVAQSKQQQAFLAGQNAALRQQQAAQFSGVTVVGPVQNSQVPWVAGLTLAQAIATANYLDSHEPGQIIITRQGESANLDPKLLLNGVQVPLEPGDLIEIHP